MADASDTAPQARSFSLKLLYVLSVIMVSIGLINSTPGIPGYDALVASVSGIDGAQLRKFPFEWFYPLFFALMMLIVVLKHSMWRDWKDRTPLRRKFGLFLDIALITMACTISVTYLVEIESICLADRITGDRARLIADFGGERFEPIKPPRAQRDARAVLREAAPKARAKARRRARYQRDSPR